MPHVRTIITLQFQSIIELLDFQSAINLVVHELDNRKLSMTANLNEQEIELAKRSYRAQVLDHADNLYIRRQAYDGKL